MADLKITQFPEATDIANNDYVAIVIGGVDYKMTVANFLKNVSVLWGGITGNIASQADLTALVDSGVTHNKDIANNASTNIFSATIANNTIFGAIMEIILEGFNGTDLTYWSGTVPLITRNKGGTIANLSGNLNSYGMYGTTGGSLFDPSGAFNAGTIISNTDASPSVFSVNPGDLGSTFSGGYLKVVYHLKVLTGQTITYL